MRALRAWVLLAAAAAFAGEVTIPEKDVPPQVLAAARKEHPEAAIVRCERERTKDATTYELRLTFSGRTVDLELDDKGTVLSEEEQVPLEALPDAVRRAASAGAKIKLVKAERITRPGAAPAYEVEVAGAHGTRELLFDEQGHPR
ncbi:MAG: PepSY-like domain-containing protein [Myxococcaceae bacterium]